MGVLAIIAGIGIGVGAIIQGIGNVQKAQSQAAEDKRKADQLLELSKPGGYYDQELNALHLELQDVEADRQAAGKINAITSLQITRQGGQLKGQVTAQAGAGNLAQTGSIVKRKDLITQTVDENLAKTRIQYEDQLRGLAGRAAQDTANQTLVEFKKNAGTQDAAALKNEADWLNTWGVALGAAGSVVSGVTGLATLGANMGLFSGGPSVDTSSQVQSTPFPEQSVGYDPYAELGLSKWWQEN